MSAAPSLANSDETAAPSITISAKSLRPWPLPQRATCSAAHSKNPASSSNRLMMMTATKVAVAFQTMCQTAGISWSDNTPADRKRVVEGKTGQVRVEHGECPSIKKQKTYDDYNTHSYEAIIRQ